MKFGYFDVPNREYVITNPEMPQPWHNYMRNDEHVGLLTHTGGGTSYWKDPVRLRLLRYKFHLTPYDRPGRYVYLRDQETGKYWSATWSPIRTPLTEMTFRCHVGMGYNRVVTQYNGIEAEVLYFVPPDDALEIWRLRLTNKSGRPRMIRSFSYAEWAVWGAQRDVENIDNAAACSRYSYEDGVFWHETPNDIGGSVSGATWIFPAGYFTSNVAPAGYDGSRDHFLGWYRDESCPIVVERGEPTNLAANGLYPLGSLCHEWKLAPGQAAECVYQMGADWKRKPLYGRIRKYRDARTVQRQFEKLHAVWEDRLGTFQCKTPDETFDTVVNTWAPYQVVNFVAGVGISPVSWGFSEGVGFRDHGQTSMSASVIDARLAREVFEHLCRMQHSSGDITKRCSPPDYGGETEFMDDQAWFAIFINAYLKETGDWSVLKAKFPFVDKPIQKDVLWKMDYALEILWRSRGKHGLPAQGAADWNDAINPLDRGSESVFNAMLFCFAAKSMDEIYTQLKRPKDAKKWAKRRLEVARAAEKHAWDGKWFIRTIMADTGRVLGSRKSKPWGNIFIEPQVWSALCESINPDMARQAMDSAHEMLGGPYGLRIVRPGCPKWEKDTGSIGIPNRGFKENGSYYSHCNAWAVCAEAVLGRGDLAFKTWMDFQPIIRNDQIETREIEPYVLGAQVQSEPFIQPGRGRNPWVTGSATWNWMGATAYILGVRGEYGGLRIDPCIPARWDGFTAVRRFRGATYEITVRNPSHVCKGVKRLIVDGRPVDGCIAPLPKRKGQRIKVEAILERI